MQTEQRLAQYALESAYRDLPESAIAVAKNVVLTVLGTTIAGARAEGCEALVRQALHWGGREESTILVHGGRVPAHNAALVNSTMARALDFCDGMVPGIHVGASSVPTALAAAELAGGCSGKEFLAALVAGSEIAMRLNAISIYDGFDPTGVCTVFATTAIAGRLIGLDARGLHDALALAFNRAGGSMQSNIDGALAVRVIQGFVSQSGILCAELARAGITGPKNFIEGTYGYFHLYAKDRRDARPVTDGLGQHFEMEKTLFKKYPSCGGTLGPTDAILALIAEHDIAAEEVARVDITVSPRVQRVVGNPFEVGDNPKVNAQFNVRYCAANALIRRGSTLRHFDDAEIRDPRIADLTRMVHVTADPSFEDPARAKFSIGTHVKITTKRGGVYEKSAAAPRGHPANPMSGAEHLQRFRDCVDYAEGALPADRIEKIIAAVARLEDMADVRDLIALLVADRAQRGAAARQPRLDKTG